MKQRETSWRQQQERKQNAGRGFSRVQAQSSQDTKAGRQPSGHHPPSGLENKSGLRKPAVHQSETADLSSSNQSVVSQCHDHQLEFSPGTSRPPPHTTQTQPKNEELTDSSNEVTHPTRPLIENHASTENLPQSTAKIDHGFSVASKLNNKNFLREIYSDLFVNTEEYSLAHCVGSDLSMSSGIAVKFRKKFRRVPELLDQNKIPGQVAFLQDSNRFVYYLVTKLTSTGKPLWKNFENSVIEWKNLCLEHGVKKVAIPKLGCGRDRLDWDRVKDLLLRQFSNTGVEILVCIIDQESSPDKKWNLKLFHTQDPLSEMDTRDCALVFIASKDRKMTKSIKSLADAYGFESDYLKQTLTLGSLYSFYNKVTKVNVFGLVVKEHLSDPVSFIDISKCLQSLRRAMKKSGLYYIGFEAFDDPKFSLVTRKLWTVVIDVFFLEDIHVYFCWSKDIQEECWEYHPAT